MGKKRGKYGRITEENVDAFIQDLIEGSSSDYIVQSVAFSKHSVKQLELLRMALIANTTFGGFMKELLSSWASTQAAVIPSHTPSIQTIQQRIKQHSVTTRAVVTNGDTKNPTVEESKIKRHRSDFV
jgi:hypothetical protein